MYQSSFSTDINIKASVFSSLSLFLNLSFKYFNAENDRSRVTCVIERLNKYYDK